MLDSYQVTPSPQKNLISEYNPDFFGHKIISCVFAYTSGYKMFFCSFRMEYKNFGNIIIIITVVITSYQYIELQPLIVIMSLSNGSSVCLPFNLY